MATYEFQHVLDVEITAAIQNKGAFSSHSTLLPLRGSLENSHLPQGFNLCPGACLVRGHHSFLQTLMKPGPLSVCQDKSGVLKITG